MTYHVEEKKVLQVARALQATRPRGCAIVDVIVYTIFYNTPSNCVKYCGVYSGGLCQAMVYNVCVCVCVCVCVHQRTAIQLAGEEAAAGGRATQTNSWTRQGR